MDPKLQNKPTMTAIHLFMFYEQLKADNFRRQNELLPEKQKIRQNPDQNPHWYFNNLKSAQCHRSKRIRTTVPVNISCQSRFHYYISFAKFWSANYRRMKYLIFKVKFV